MSSLPIESGGIDEVRRPRQSSRKQRRGRAVIFHVRHTRRGDDTWPHEGDLAEAFNRNHGMHERPRIDIADRPGFSCEPLGGHVRHIGATSARLRAHAAAVALRVYHVSYCRFSHQAPVKRSKARLVRERASITSRSTAPRTSFNVERSEPEHVVQRTHRRRPCAANSCY